MTAKHVLFLVASTRVPGVVGNTEWLARQAAAALPAEVRQTWVHLNQHRLPDFVDHRHDVGSYPMPEGDTLELLNLTLAADELVLVAPVYWYSLPAKLKLYLDHYSAWMRVPGLDFKSRMAAKRLWFISTSGDRAKAQPTVDTVRLCAEFLGMGWQGALWGKGGPPGAIEQDAQAHEAAAGYFKSLV